MHRLVAWRAALSLLLVAGCTSGADPRPSILLVVFDTLRSDAVSAYGAVQGTTPAIDALAAGGLLYENAFAPSPWTLPSHATLLTGAPVTEHGVGVRGRMTLPEEVTTLAERLAAVGYRTAAFSENPLLSPPFGLLRGFEHVAVESVAQRIAARRGQPPAAERFDAVAEVARWAAQADRSRPWFVFVNLFDPHDPYDVREHNPFLPPDVDPARARRVQPVAEHAAWSAQSPGICGRLPPAEDLAILRGLYLGDVAAADTKLAHVSGALGEASGSPLVQVVTSDHGEHLGEHRLLGHEFSVRNVLLHVPLVVHGLPGVAPARIAAPVALGDLVPAILSWTGTRARDPLAGRPLPLRPGTDPRERALLAVWSDQTPRAPEAIAGLAEPDAEAREVKREGCHAADRVYGHMAALTRFPFKLIWYERHAPQLYDLSWDPGERSDLAAMHPERVAALRAALEAPVRELGLERSSSRPAQDVSPEAARALRGLGYLE